MTVAFIRDYKITILSPKIINANIGEDVLTNQVVKFVTKSTDALDDYKDYRTKHQLADPIEIHTLHFEADVTYRSSSDSSGSQVSTFKVYNLSKAKIKKIKRDSLVILDAGYKNEDVLPMVFTGLIVDIDTQRVGENQVTSFTCKDVSAPLRGVRASITFTRNTTYRTVIETLMDRLARKGIPRGRFIEESTYTPQTYQEIVDAINPPSVDELDKRNVEAQLDAINYGVPVDYFKNPFPNLDTPLVNGYNVEGNVFEELKQVCQRIGFRAYIVLGKLYIEPIHEPKRQGRVSINEDQVRGGIKKQGDSSSKSLKSSEGKTGIIVETFLNGRITANKILTVTYGESKGDYKIMSVRHRLSFEGNDWVTICKCISIGG